MQAKRKNRPIIYGTDGTAWIECEVTYPPSAIGRTVDVFLDAQEVVALMKDLRTASIELRQQPMTTS